MAKQEPAPFHGGENFRGLVGKPDFDWRDAPLKAMPVSALPPHLQAAHRLKAMRLGPSTLQKLRKEALEHVWTIDRFQQEVEKAIEELAKKNASR